MPIDNPEKRKRFPRLLSDGGQEKSPETPDRDYNCIAFALDITDAIWWPGRDECYWPNYDDDETFDSFAKEFKKRGYTECDSGDFEPGFEKVAFFVSRGDITHACRQLPDGRWKSKLGLDWEDVEHDTLQGVESNSYGSAKRFMKRPITKR